MDTLCGHWAAYHLLAGAVRATHPAVDPNTLQDPVTFGEWAPLHLEMQPELW